MIMKELDGCSVRQSLSKTDSAGDRGMPGTAAIKALKKKLGLNIQLRDQAPLVHTWTCLSLAMLQLTQK
jgi:hypothetical protein